MTPIRRSKKMPKMAVKIIKMTTTVIIIRNQLIASKKQMGRRTIKMPVKIMSRRRKKSQLL